MLKNKSSHIDLIITFVLIYCSIDTLLFGTNSNEIFQIILVSVLFIIILFFPLVKRRIFTVNKSSLILVLFILLSMLINFDISLQNIYFFLLLFLSIEYTFYISIEAFINYFCKIIVFLSAYSLIITVIYYLNNQILDVLPIIINSNGLMFNNALFSFSIIGVETIGDIYRNYGLFREPGIFSLYIIVSLLFFVFYYKDDLKKNISSIAILCLTLISTFSTTGILLLFIIFFRYVLDKFKRLNLWHLFVFVLLGVMFLFVFIKLDLWSAIIGKLFTENHSMGSRIYSISTNLTIILDNPILGVGWNNYVSTMNSYLINGVVISNTNTILKLCAIYGLPFTIIFFYNIFLIVKKIFKKNIIFILICSLVLLFTEDISLNIIIYILFVYGCRINKSKIKEVSHESVVDL